MRGALAQLGARHTGSVKVTGSNPVCSIHQNIPHSEENAGCFLPTQAEDTRKAEPPPTGAPLSVYLDTFIIYNNHLPANPPICRAGPEALHCRDTR